MKHTHQDFTLEQADAAAVYFHEHGYAVFRKVWSGDEMARAHEATDQVKQRSMEIGSPFRHGNINGWVVEDANIGLNVLGIQWPGHWSPVLEAMRRDARMLQILQPLIGPNIRQIIHQIHWKTPGATFAVSFHRDRRSRNPPQDYRDLANSYVQTGTAIDPMTPENGALLVIPGSHRDGKPLADSGRSSFTSKDPARTMIHNAGYTDDDLLPIYAEAGDVALWHVDTIHGSDTSRSAQLDRCLFINGYVKAESCMRGHWAFINGTGVPLPPPAVPVLVQRNDIFDNLEFEFGIPLPKLMD